MNLTYEKIYDDMTSAYFNECGENPKTVEDIDAKIKTVASEIYGVSCYGDYILNQAFAQTAVGEMLDLQGEMRGIERKSDSLSKGNLKFFITQEKESETLVPKGTICSIKDKPFIQFETDEDATILAGETSVTVGATASSAGESYNAYENEINVIVNPPTSVSSVNNETAFKGGALTENDESYRGRIVASYSVPLNGVNSESLRAVLLKIDNILDAIVSRNEETSSVSVYVRTRDNELSDETKAKINDKLGICTLCGVNINSYLASQKDENVTINARVLAAFDDNTVKENITEKTKEFFVSRKIGEVVNLSDLLSELSTLDGVGDVAIASSTAVFYEISCGVNEYITLGELQVKTYE